jgi:hypothetical protein
MKKHIFITFLSVALCQGILLAKTELNSEADTLYQRAYKHLCGPCDDCNLIDVKKWVERAKELGHPEAPYLLGLMYYEGLGVAKNIEKAAAMFEVAARTGHAKSQTYLGLGYLKQAMERWDQADYRGDKPNSTTKMLEERGYRTIQGAYEGMKLLAEGGETEAMCFLARMCMGMGMAGQKKDEALASYWRESAAKTLRQSWTSKRGNQAHIAYQLGMLYTYAPDNSEQLIWLSRAAELGHVRAEFELGFHYYVGKECEKAVTLLEKAAQKQHVEAQYLLANHSNVLDKYLEKQKFHSGLYWLEKAAGNGHAVAARILGGKYDYHWEDKNNAIADESPSQLNGEQSDQRDKLWRIAHRDLRDKYDCQSKNPKEAIRWYSVAVKLGDVDAESRLGDFYYRGEGVQQDYNEALKYFKEVVIHEDDDRYYFEVMNAAFMLGTMYEKGEGVQRDYVNAVNLYKLAARQGSGKSQYRLAEMYYKGNGVLQDYVEAYAWANIAASKGGTNTTALRDEIIERMTPEQIAEGQRKARELSKNLGLP